MECIERKVWGYPDWVRRKKRYAVDPEWRWRRKWTGAFSFGKKRPGLWLLLPPVFNLKAYQVVGNLETNCLLGTSFESHGPFVFNCTTHFCFVIFYLWNLFNIKLHCLHVSQAMAPCMMFIKLLFIKYALLVIRLKIIRALVWSSQGEQSWR